MPSSNRNTIYLTPEEDARLRKNFKDRIQTRRELSGQPREPSDLKTLRSQVIYADLMSDMQPQSGGQDAIVAYAVGDPYPPCVDAVEDLEPMGLGELRMETHHRERVLIVKRVTPVVRLKVCSWTVVQDESGDAERLEVVLHKEDHGKDILESGEMFRVLEPYFTVGEQGEPTLRVDHPSDLVVVHTDRAMAKTAERCKEEGNAALKQQNLLLAHAKYTSGLEIVQDSGTTKEDITFDLYRNRAHVNLRIHRLDEAKTDALASLTNLPYQKHIELDSKAYFRAGTAAYQLGEYQEAKRCFQEQKRLNPANKDATARIRKTEQRIHEEETGSYNFKKLKASLLLSSRREIAADAACFTRNVFIKASPGRGRGLFAKSNIEAGELIMCEKSFCVVWENEQQALTSMTYDFRDDRIRVFPAGLCRAVVRRLLDNPSQVGRAMDLYGDYRGPDVEQQRLKNKREAVIDVFQVHDIVARNAFGPEPGTSSAGLWMLASYINHSCLPNSEKEYIGDLMVLRATRPIAAGEEITHAYDLSSDYDARMETLMRTWGFRCDCKFCVAEKKDSAAVRKRRRDLEREASALVEKGETGRLAVVKAKRLAREIEGTFDEERYSGLPRMALMRIQKWIVEAGKK
ncbi:SET domain-containing protein [Hyaloscypha variabilis F]|uniref:SET domain-containing protein n=1 Tax=Hyaloscypha variabilis (strain UAMH 11265 / GT02V1 / F) TaxID=1149755 RepID=A0A2J6R6Q7_HYAVF|nr:SET domain-containing protein [Hyaloscypha variabilis F]